MDMGMISLESTLLHQLCCKQVAVFVVGGNDHRHPIDPVDADPDRRIKIPVSRCFIRLDR